MKLAELDFCCFPRASLNILTRNNSIHNHLLDIKHTQVKAGERFEHVTLLHLKDNEEICEFVPAYVPFTLWGYADKYLNVLVYITSYPLTTYDRDNSALENSSMWVNSIPFIYFEHQTYQFKILILPYYKLYYSSRKTRQVCLPIQ